MPIQGLNFKVLSGFEGHQSYQSTGSFTVYNPNDGVAFVATDRTATGLSWDYKVPSQSGGRFPGPINSYLSIFYLDQSGGGAPGEIVVYAQPEQINVPYFWSIGRAVQSQSSSLDIVGGPQPGNPGAGIGRLWIDTGGHLNVLQPSGANYLVIDSNNLAANVQPLINATTLAGDLFGTIGNAHVGIQNGSSLYTHDTHNTNYRVLSSANTDSFYIFTGTNGNLYFYSDYPGGTMGLWQSGAGNSTLTIYGYLNVGANFSVGGTLTSTGSGAITNGWFTVGPAAVAQAGDIGSARTGSPTTGIIYLGNTGSRYLYYDGTYYQMPNGNINTRYYYTSDGSNGAIYAGNGSLYLRSASGIIVIDAGGGGSGALQVATGITAGTTISAGGPIRAGANTGFLGEYKQGVNWSSSTVNTWIATPVTVSFTVPAGHSGSLFYGMETMVTSAVQGTIFYIAVALDGSITDYRAGWIALANGYQIMPAHGAWTGVAAGAHTATLYVQANAGVFSTWSGAHTTLTVEGMLS